MDEISLINGAVPVIVLVAGGVALLAPPGPAGPSAAASPSSPPWSPSPSPPSVFLGLGWLVTQGLDLFPEALPEPVTAWIAVAVGILVLVVGNLVGTSVGRKVLALASGLVILVAAGSQINIYFAYYPTVGALTGSEADVNALTGAAQRPSQAVTTPVVDRWTGPATGTSQVVTASIPGTVSGFTARDAYIYLPPAYTSPSPPLLPVLILVSGQPGGPQDWVTAGNLQAQLDQFAAANNGLAPVAVVVDPNGPNDTITMCMDSNIAKADTYLSQDVPNWITAELGVDANHAHWAFGGFSYGGTCAIQMATRHTNLYPSFIDISGEREPAISTNRTQTVQTAFGGNTAEFDALTPLTLLSQRQYPNVWGYFSVGANDTEFVKEMTEVSTAAQKAGMTVRDRAGAQPGPLVGRARGGPAAGAGVAGAAAGIDAGHGLVADAGRRGARSRRRAGPSGRHPRRAGGRGCPRRAGPAARDAPPAGSVDADELIAEYDEERPGRRLSPGLDRVVVGLCFLTSLFVLWQVFAPLQRGNQYYLVLFLAAVLPLVFVCYRPRRRSRSGERDDPGPLDWVLAGLALLVALYPVLPIGWGDLGDGPAAGSTRSSTVRDRSAPPTSSWAPC